MTLCLALGALLLAPTTGTAQSPRWEVSLWGGYTSLEVPGATSAEGADPGVGLRFAELAIWYTPDLRLWVQYDNGLTLDNFELRDGRPPAPSLYLGGLHAWGGRFITRLEGGWREVAGVGQTLVRGEQVTFLARPLALRAGGWAGIGNDGRTDLLWHGGFTWIINRHIHIDPTFFFSPGQGGREPVRHRALLFGEYQTDDGWKAGVGLAGGKGGEERVFDGFLLLAAPLQGGHEARVLMRREVISEVRTISSISIGMTLRLDGR